MMATTKKTTKNATQAEADVIATIAHEHLRIETLAERKMDSLDFYSLAVWNIEDALRAAYRAGQASNQTNRQ